MPPENPLYQFYCEHNISPVHQDISDFRLHLKRREGLYRRLGMPPVLFANQIILEIGPGGGYNALAFLAWGASINLVEPNPKAQEEIPLLMQQYGADKSSWTLFPGKIEEYEPEKKYDAVIAEGFLPGIYNRREVIAKMSGLVKPGGVIVVTCVDEISFCFEVLKRLLAFQLVKDTASLEDKVKILARAFATHLQSLKHASRPVEDWVTDQFLNPAIHAELFSMADCLQEFGEQFAFLGSSPALFTDLSWYKDMDYREPDSQLEQFARKRHVLLLWNMPLGERPAELNERLLQTCAAIRQLEGEYERQPCFPLILNIIEKLNEMKILTSDLDYRIPAAIEELITLLLVDKLDERQVSQAPNLAAAFGRGQQYVGMVKKFTL